MRLPERDPADVVPASARSDRVLASLVLVAGLVVALVMTALTNSSIEDRRQQEFANRVSATRAVVNRRVGAYTEVLYGMRSVLTNDPQMTPEAFSLTVRQLDLSRRLPGSLAISWSPRIRTKAEIDAFEARTIISGRTRPGMTPGADHYAVEYIEPRAGNEAAVGFDLLSEPVRRAAVFSARDGGDPVASGPLDLVQGGRGFVVYLAVYDEPLVPVTAPARRRHIRGVVTAVFHLEQMLREVAGTDRPVEVEIHDVGLSVGRPSSVLGPASLLFDSSGRGWAQKGKGASSLRKMVDLNVADRRWRMFAFAGPDFPTSLDRLLPAAVGLGAGLFSLLAAGLVLALSRSRRLAVGLARDMTSSLREREADLRDANAEMELVNSELVSLNRSMREFVAVASHELRTPLAAIIGASEILKKVGISPDSAQLIDIVSRQSEALSSLVTDLLTVSSIDAGTMTTNPQIVSVADAARSVCEDNNLEGTEFDCPPDVFVRCDPDHLRRILTNYLINATVHGGPPVSVSSSIAGEFVSVTVADRGAGVAADVVDRLFGRFARSAQGHSGLGLSIVRGLARANGGDASYRAREGGGSQFGVTLPLATAVNGDPGSA